ncbi:MAG: PadR family transcriptional regulator [Anaerolineaceae bacterium]|nr:PadR family transcriptional regulator [Anaerolineaceae bacterium]MBN2677743.1 PadR family transcriptional regulator [Anaerolineaceae bacterium]
MSVRNALLGLLAQKSRHGYELRSAFVAMLGGEANWDLKPAQVYTTLSRLAEAGLVKQQATLQSGGPEKTIYAITPAGKKELRKWFESPVEASHQQDEVYLKLVLSLATGNADPYHILQTQRASLYRQLHDVTTRRNDTDPERDLAILLLHDQTIMHLEADLRWLDMVEGRLDEIRKQPVPSPLSRTRGRPPNSAKDPPISLPERVKK